MADILFGGYPATAPLSAPIADYLFSYYVGQLPLPISLTLDDQIERWKQEIWTPFEQKLHEARNAAFQTIDQIINPAPPQISTEHQERGAAFQTTDQIINPAPPRISTKHFTQMLAKSSPDRHLISPQTLTEWTKLGLIRKGNNEIDPHSSSALLIARMLDPRLRRWLPMDGISEGEPHWWCWAQESPDHAPYPCPIPLPHDLPPGTLLWTPWQGAAWDQGWLSVQPIETLRSFGSIRFAPSKAKLWNISSRELYNWDKAATFDSIDRSLGPLAFSASAFHAKAEIILLRLAKARLLSGNP